MALQKHAKYAKITLKECVFDPPALKTQVDANHDSKMPHCNRVAAFSFNMSPMRI